MKKVWIVALFLAFALCLSACGAADGSKDPERNEQSKDVTREGTQDPTGTPGRTESDPAQTNRDPAHDDRDPGASDTKEPPIDLPTVEFEPPTAEPPTAEPPTAEPEPTLFKITYETEGGVHSNPTTYTAGMGFALQDAVREGYVFDGWYLNGSKVTAIANGIKGDLVLTAKWIEEKSDFSFQLLDDGTYELVRYLGGDEAVEIPAFYRGAAVTSIGNNAFLGRSNVKTVIIPDGVKTIGKQAFYQCTSLTAISLPDSVTSLGAQAFAECQELADVKLSSGLTVLEEKLFYNCWDLENLVIPNSVKEIKEKVLDGCHPVSLTIPFVGDRAVDPQYPFLGYLFGCQYLSSQYQMVPKTLTTVILNQGYDIPATAFYQCMNLKSVTLGEGTKVIGNSAFENCVALTEVILPEGLTTISYQAFYSCTALKKISIPSTIIHVGESAFEGYQVEYNEKDGIGYLGNQKDPYLVAVYLSQYKLEDVVFAEGCRSVMARLFDSNKYVKSVTFPKSMVAISNSLFNNCGDLAAVHFAQDGSLTEIGSYAFYKCYDLTELAIPDSVTEIRDSAFAYCNGITKLSFGEKSRLTTLGYAVFSECTRLTEVVLPESLTSMGNSCFSGCVGLTRLVLPSGLTKLSDGLLSRCTSLASIVIPVSVTEIGDRAFDYGYIETVYYGGTQEQWNAVEIGSSNDPLKSATHRFYSETVTANGWHYVDGIPTAW